MICAPCQLLWSSRLDHCKTANRVLDLRESRRSSNVAYPMKTCGKNEGGTSMPEWGKAFAMEGESWM